MRIAGIVLLVIVIVVSAFLFIRLNNGPARADWQQIPLTQAPQKVLDTLRKQLRNLNIQGVTCLNDTCGNIRLEFREINIPLFDNYRLVTLMLDGNTVLEVKDIDFKPPYIILDKTMYYAERTPGDTSKKITLFYKPLS